MQATPLIATGPTPQRAVQPWPTPRRRVVAVALMLGAALMGAALMTLVLPYEPVAVRIGASASTAVWFWYTLWMNAMVALLALVAVARLRERRQAVAGLARVQEQARIVRQQMAHTQLQAIQARVDPQLLFDMLSAVKRFYEEVAALRTARCIELDARTAGAVLRVQVTDSTLLAAPAMERLRRSLADLYGDNARLHVAPRAAGSEIVMEVPLEHR
jgi:hypothetical protein